MAAPSNLAGLTALLVIMEAGVPLPFPTDLLLLLVGERASAGTYPLWLAVLALEVVAVAGTSILFFAARGPGHGLVARLGPRIGLTRERLARVTSLLQRRGRPAMAAGRATPGLRTITVVAAGTSGFSPRPSLPALIAGSTLFVQVHLVLGYVFGAAAREAIDAAKGPVLVGLAVFVVAAAALWLWRRRGGAGAQSWTEACCPACLAVGLLAPQLAEERSLSGRRRGR